MLECLETHQEFLLKYSLFLCGTITGGGGVGISSFWHIWQLQPQKWITKLSLTIFLPFHLLYSPPIINILLPIFKKIICVHIIICMYNLNQYVITIFIGIAKIIIMAAIIIMIVKMCLWQDILIYNFCYEKDLSSCILKGTAGIFFFLKIGPFFYAWDHGPRTWNFCQITVRMIYILGPWLQLSLKSNSVKLTYSPFMYVFFFIKHIIKLSLYRKHLSCNGMQSK